jgi:hypothetical protein
MVYIVLYVFLNIRQDVLEVSMVLMHPSHPDHVPMSCVEIQIAMFILEHSVKELALYILWRYIADTLVWL